MDRLIKRYGRNRNSAEKADFAGGGRMVVKPGKSLRAKDYRRSKHRFGGLIFSA
jgi:hypothetical protein